MSKRYTLLKQFIFFFLFVSIINISQNKPPEDEFIPLISHEMQKFELNRTHNELYYSFDNKYENSDIIINLQIGNCFSTFAYIYDSYEKISQDESGDYIFFIKEIRLNKTLLLIKNSELPIEQKKYYIILKDKFKISSIDYITIFNELDIIQLQKEKPIIIDMFYSQNEYFLSFDFEINETITLELNANNEDFSSYIIITDINSNEEIYKGIKNKGNIIFNENKNYNGNYIMEIISDEESYKEIKMSLILHKNIKKIIELKSYKKYEFTLGNSRIYNFYINIDKYDYNEENIVVFKFDPIIYDNKLLSHCYSKTMNFVNENENKLIANMPAKEEENEGLMERLSSSDTIYYLYFRKSVEKEENKTSYLLIHLSFNNDDDIYFNPSTISIYLSNKTEKIDLNELDIFSLNKKIKLNSYIPQVFRIILPVNKNDFNYLFYVTEKVMEIYNDTMFNSSYDKYDNRRYTYFLSAKEKNEVKVLYIKLYSVEREINLRIDSTKNKIYYLFDEQKPIKSIISKITKCTQETFYYFAEYQNNQNASFFLEEIYGDFNLYYKNDISEKDESILINENKKYLIKNKYGISNSAIELIEIECNRPGYSHLNLLEYNTQLNVELFSRKFGYISKEKELQIIPNVSPNQEDINIEISTPTGKEIKINMGIDEIILNEKNKYYLVNYKTYDDLIKLFTVSSKEDTIISFSITNKDKFIVIKDNYTYVDYESQFVIPLKNSIDYESITLNIDRVYHEYSYSIFKGNYEYATILSNSGFDYPLLSDKKINLTINNPYLMYNTTESFYIVLSFIDPEMLFKNVYLNYNPIKEYENIKFGKAVIINENNKKYLLEKIDENYKDIKIISQSCNNSLNKINLYNYNDMLYSFQNINTKKYNYNKINNYLFDMQIEAQLIKNKTDYQGVVIGLSKENITKEEVEKYENLSLNVSLNDTKIEWEKINSTKIYEVYVFDEKSEKIKYINNPCFLQAIKDNKTDNDSYSKYYITENNNYKLEEKGNYTVKVVAYIEGNIPLIFMFNDFLYDSDKIPKDIENNDLLFWIILSIIICCALLTFAVVYLLLMYLEKEKEKARIQASVARNSDINKINNSMSANLL